MNNFIELNAVNKTSCHGKLYVRESDIQAFGAYFEMESNAKSFVQVAGQKYTLTDEVFQIYLKINESIKAQTVMEKENVNSTKVIVQESTQSWMDEPFAYDFEGVEGFVTRVYNALVCAGYRTWRDLHDVTEYELCKARGITKNTAKEVKRIVRKKNGSAFFLSPNTKKRQLPQMRRVGCLCFLA